MADLIDKMTAELNRFLITKMTSTDFGMQVFKSLAEPYLAGHSLEEALVCIEHYNSKNLYSTFDILGEAASTMDEANANVQAYISIIHLLSSRYKNKKVASVSIKPSMICCVDNKSDKEKYAVVDPRTPLPERLEFLSAYARLKAIDLTLDMENHHWTDRSLDAAKLLWKKGHPLGIVLQSRLDRTRQDIENLFYDAAYDVKFAVPLERRRVRACIGAYIESEEIATNSKKLAKEFLIQRVQELFDAGVYVEIATHDRSVIRRIIKEVIEPDEIPSDRFEFQFLTGVWEGYKASKELQELGYRVRFYVPCELAPGSGIPYIKRRLIENPGMVWSGAKNVVQLACK